MPSDAHIRRLLDEIESQPHASQRSLAARLGIALGLTNLLLRRVAAKGWVRIVRIRPNRVRYLLTPAGIMQRAKMSRDYLQSAVQFYGEARDRVEGRFAQMLRDANGSACRRVVFYGADEVAEVGYICVQRLPLRLVAIVDEDHAGRDFFGLAVQPVASLADGRCGDTSFDRLVVMSFGNREQIQRRLDEAGVQRDRVFWV